MTDVQKTVQPRTPPTGTEGSGLGGTTLEVTTWRFATSSDSTLSVLTEPMAGA
jgi:hypothetical protein